MFVAPMRPRGNGGGAPPLRRAVMMFTFGLLFAASAKRYGFKQTSLFLIMVLALWIEYRGRKLAAQFRRMRYQALPGAAAADLQQQRRSNVLLFANGQITRIPAAHLHMMMHEGDFTADDYEMLLTLDANNNNSTNGNPQAATQEELARLTTVELDKNELLTHDSCAICLEKFQLSEIAKQMPCMHTFHTACLDEWLAIKGTCPLCLKRCEA